MVGTSTRKLWRALFGHYTKGDLVIFKKELHKEYPHMWVWTGSYEVIKIPTHLFVGEIVGRCREIGRDAYYIKWVADNRPKGTRELRFFIWESYRFEVLDCESTEVQ